MGKGGNEELKILRTENKRLKKIINDIRNLTNYDDDTFGLKVGEVLDEIKEKEQDKKKDEKKTKKEIISFDQRNTTKSNDDDTKDQDKNTTNDGGESGQKDKGKMIWDAYLAEFKDKMPEYAKELMYYSRRLAREKNDDSLIMTLIEAQAVNSKYGKGGMVYTTEEEEKQRLEATKVRPIMYEKLLQITSDKNNEE